MYEVEYSTFWSLNSKTKTFLDQVSAMMFALIKRDRGNLIALRVKENGSWTRIPL